MKSLKSVKENNKAKFFGGVVSALILIFLVVSGPASAYVVDLAVADGSSTTVDKSEKITFDARVILPDGKTESDITGLKIIFNGPVVKECVFDIDGKAISGCFNIQVDKVDNSNSRSRMVSSGYGYGYGYGYGDDTASPNLSYQITIHSQHFVPGTYATELVADFGSDERKTNGENITITGESKASDKGHYSGTSDSLSFGLTGVKLDLKTSSSVSGNVSVVEYSSRPAGVNVFTVPGISKYIEISADSQIEENMGESIIKVYYDDAAVTAAGIDEWTLRLYYYNTTSGLWEKYDTPRGDVDVVNNYVWAKTNHFSTWAVGGNLMPVASSNYHSSNRNSNSNSKVKSSELLAQLPQTNQYYSGPVVEQNNAVQGTASRYQPIALNNTNNARPKPGVLGLVTGAFGGFGASTGALIAMIFVALVIGMLVFVRIARRRVRREHAHATGLRKPTVMNSSTGKFYP